MSGASSYPPGMFGLRNLEPSYGDVATCTGCGRDVDVTVVQEPMPAPVPEECEACGGRLELE